jgi:hypothetical protein
MWTKYEYVCPDCDALLEVTTLQDLDLWRPWCGCGSPNLNRINKYDVTEVTHAK